MDPFYRKTVEWGKGGGVGWLVEVGLEGVGVGSALGTRFLNTQPVPIFKIKSKI